MISITEGLFRNSIANLKKLTVRFARKPNNDLRKAAIVSSNRTRVNGEPPDSIGLKPPRK